MKHCCSSLLHRNVGEERQERQELCSKEVEEGRAAAAPSLPPHTPTAPPPPAPGPCLALSTGRRWLRQWLPPSAAAAMSRHSFPGAPSWQGLSPAPGWVSVIAAGPGPKYPAPAGPAVSGACTGQAGDPCQLQLVWGSLEINLFA